MTFSISTASIGSVVGRQSVDVTFRMTSAYAAAIGAEDDLYLDDGVDGGAVAPPAFLVVLEWPMLLSQPYIGLIGASEERYFEFLLHAFQDTHYRRLVRAGDRIELVATIVEVRTTSAGALVVCRVDTTNARDGRLVATSWIGSLFRGLTVNGSPVCLEPAPALSPVARPAAPVDEETIAISRALPFIYTECSGHWNPIHTERAFAGAAGYPDIVVHGTATWAMVSQRLIHAYGGGDPRRLKRYGARFSSLVTPGQRLTLCRTKDSGLRTIDFAVADAAGKTVLSHGIAIFDDA